MQKTNKNINFYEYELQILTYKPLFQCLVKKGYKISLKVMKLKHDLLPVGYH